MYKVINIPRTNVTSGTNARKEILITCDYCSKQKQIRYNQGKIDTFEKRQYTTCSLSCSLKMFHKHNDTKNKRSKTILSEKLVEKHEMNDGSYIKVFLQHIEHSNRFVPNNKNYKRVIRATCNLENCNKIFEHIYRKHDLGTVIKRGYVACCKSHGALLREIHMDPATNRERRKKWSIATTKRNRKWWDNITDEKLDKMMKATHKTNKRRGNYKRMTSKAEDHVYALLLEDFNTDNVKRQYYVKRWPIDIYIEPIKLFIQIDGVYWHGLNRSLIELRQRKNSHDITISQAIIADSKQNEYFLNNNMLLCRITDKQALACKTTNQLCNMLYSNIVSSNIHYKAIHFWNIISEICKS